MSEYIEVGQPLQFTDPNTPTRVGEIVENVSDIYNIPSPRLGMQVFVKSEKKTYTITGLKEAVIGGERVPDAKVDTFEAVKSQVEEINNDFAEMQKALIDGSFVVGIAKAVKAGAVTFEMLDGKLQLSASVVDDLETDDALKPLSANQGKVLKELIDIINGTGEGSTDKKITDAIAKLVDNAPENLDTLKELAEWIKDHGTEVAEMLAAINANATAIKTEAERATEAESDIKATAISKEAFEAFATSSTLELGCKTLAGEEFAVELPPATTKMAGVMSAADKVKLNASIKNVDVSPNTDDVELDLEDNTGSTTHVVFPAATTEKAGVMSADDKKRMAACNSYLVNDASNLQDAINTLNNILPGGDKVSGVIVNFVDENGSLRSFVFSSNVGGFTNPVRWIDIAANQTYIVDDKPANSYRLSELIENIKVQADGEFDVNATYSIGQFGYAPSLGSNVVEIKRDGARLGFIYFNDSLVGELDASNLKIVVSVKSFGLAKGVFDYSQYNRINPRLFIDAYESWKLNSIDAVANKNTTAIAVVADDINSVKDVVYESGIVTVDTMVQQGKYYNSLGRLVDDSARCCTVPFDVVAGERYYITCRIGGSTVIAYVAMWGADGEWLGVADGFVGGSDDAVDRMFIVPEEVEKVAVSSYNTTSPSVTKSIRSNITAYYTKRETYNRSEIDILISNSPSGGGGSDVDSNFINNVETISFNVEDNAITEAVVLGTGWSGDLTNGYVHASGNSEPLEFNLPYASGDKFVLEFKCDGVKGDSTDLLIAVGDTPTVKSYNGTSEFRIGFVANGGRLKITPASNFASAITDITVSRISNNGNRTISVNVGDVYSQANSMITAFWNIAIGSKNVTLSKLINGSRNVAIGRNTLNTATSGNRNIAIGTFAMPFLTEAEENVAIGADTIYPLTKAFGCVGIGKATLSGTQKAEYCVAVGKGAMGTYNLSKDRTKCTAIGVDAGPSITDSCTHVGYRAGANVAGAKNTSIGYGSMAVGERSTVDITGEELTCIGYYSQIDNTEEAKAAKNSTAIGANTKITKSNQVVIGNANVEEVIIAGKRIIFHADGSVKWENI